MTKHFCNRCIGETIMSPQLTVADLIDIEDRHHFHLCADCYSQLIRSIKAFMKERPSVITR